jgi:hypothetical protein
MPANLPAVGFDCESKLTQPGRQAPPMICLSWDDGKESGLLHREVSPAIKLRQDAIERLASLPDDPEHAPLRLATKRRIAGYTQEIARGTGVQWAVEKLRKREHLLVGHNVSYDLGVVVAASADPAVCALVFAALDKGRVADSMIRQHLLKIAKGSIKYDPETERPPAYALSDLSAEWLGEYMTGKDSADAWRYRYHELEDVPVLDWPEEASSYALSDATVTRRIWDCQVRAGEVVDQDPQVRADWALHLTGAWGLRTDLEAVDALEKTLRETVDAALVKLEAAGLYRWEGTKKEPRRSLVKNMAVIQSRTEAAYRRKAELASAPFELFQFGEVLPGETVCPWDEDSDSANMTDGSVRTVWKTPRLDDYVGPERHWVERSRGGAGPGPFAPLTKGGKAAMAEGLPWLAAYVSTAKETLEVTGDDDLELLAEVTGDQKLLSTYIPILRQGTQLPINARYNVLVATGRTSCVAKGTLVEIVRDVSAAPKGVPIEDVRVGDLVYCYTDDGRLQVKPVEAAFKTGHREVVRVHWQGSGHKHTGHVDLTPEHTVRLSDGRWVAASDLKLGDSVTALSRGIKGGYPYLYATGYTGEIREHSFLYSMLVGDAEHVHHVNENKLDNRLENLEGLSAAEHTAHHGAHKSPEAIEKHRSDMIQRWQTDHEGMRSRVLRGTESPRWLGLSREWLIDQLRKHKGKPTEVCKEHGIDYETFQGYLAREGVDFASIAKEFNGHGERMDRAFVEKMRALHGTARTKDVLKQIGLGYYRWAEVQRDHGFVPNNHRVLRVEQLPESVDVYDLTVKDCHNFIAGELCVHNCAKPNVQNQPRKGGVRGCFVPRKGHWFAACDYASAELVSLAQILVDKYGLHRSEMAQTLIAKRKILLVLAAGILGISYEDAVRRHKEHDPELVITRQLAKAAAYGFPGGMGPSKFVITAKKQTGMIMCGKSTTPGPDHNKRFDKDGVCQACVDITAELKAAWLQTFPEMRTYFKEIGDRVTREGGSFTLEHHRSGRLRGLVKFNDGCNSWFQGLVADGAKAALYSVAKECYTGVPYTEDLDALFDRGWDGTAQDLPRLGVAISPLYGTRPVAFIHDEIILEVPADYAIARPAVARMSVVMVAEMRRFCPDIPVGADGHLMARWEKSAEPVFNEAGELLLWEPEHKEAA